MFRYLFENIIKIVILSIITILLIICGLVLYKTVQIYKLIYKYRKVPGSEPKGLLGFFLGDLLEIFECKKNGSNFAKFLENKISNYGDTCKFRLFDKMVIATIDPAFIKAIFIDENYPKEKYLYKTLGFPGNQRGVGYGLVTEVNHEIWKQHRAYINPGFQRQALMTFMKEFNATGDVLVTYLRKFADGHTKVKLLDEFNRATHEVIARVGFSMNVNSINDSKSEISQYFRDAFEFFQLCIENPLFNFNPFLWYRVSKYKQSLRELRKIGRYQILKRIEAIKNEDPVPNDILTTILMNSSGEQNIDMETFIDEFITFFGAGQETTATTLAFLFRELTQNPDVLEKLRNEIDIVLGAKSIIENKDLAELKYTGAVIKETLRLFPPAPVISRSSPHEIKMEKFTIPKNSWIMASPYVSSRREEYFTDPLKFKPERFLKDESSQGNTSTYAYYPFSLGPRNCIGQNFAQIEAKILIAKFIQNFDFKLDSNEAFQEEVLLTLHPKDGTHMYLTIR